MTPTDRWNRPSAGAPAWILGAGLAVAVLLWAWWLLAGMAWTREIVAAQSPHPPTFTRAPADRDHAFSELGQSGDAFGGLNALLTAIAGALVAWAGTLQHLALKHAKAEAEEEREALRRQQFETLFFQLLALLAEATARIDGPWRVHPSAPPAPGQRLLIDGSPNQHGAGALDAHAQKLFQWVRFELADEEASDGQILDTLVRGFAHEVHDQRPAHDRP